MKSSRNVWMARLMVAGLVLVVLSYFAYRYRGHLSSAFGWLAQETGGKTLAILVIGLGLWILVCGIFWLIFPILVYFGLKDLRRRTAQLDQTLQMYGRNLTLPANDPRGKTDAR